VQELRDLIAAGPHLREAGRAPDPDSTPVLDRYVEDVGGRFDLGRPVKVVVDCGNGTGAVVAVRLLERAGAEVIPLYCESDGTFPNHHPDPTVDENVVDCIELVLEHGADVGIGFDGDADRIGAVDDRGRIIRGDILLLLYGLDLLRRRGPGQLLIFDVKCSQVLPEVYEAAGGKATHVEDGPLPHQGEDAGDGRSPRGRALRTHLLRRRVPGIDDALYDACRLLELLATGGPPLSERVDAFPQYVSTPEIRIEVTEETKVEVVERAVAHFSRRPGGDRRGRGPDPLRRRMGAPPVLQHPAGDRGPLRGPDPGAPRRDPGEVEGWLRDQGVDV
jgi:phosphomannomutase / phosphoglucomutase